MDDDNFDFEKDEIINTLFKDTSTFDEHDEVKEYAEEFSTNLENILGELEMVSETENVTAPSLETENGTVFSLDTILEEDVLGNNETLFSDAHIFRDDFINMQNDLRQVHVDIPEIDVSNVVCKSFVGCRINLKHCNQYMKNSSMHTHQKFPALFIRLKNPDLSILLFTTGNVVITGARLYEDACMAVQKLVGLLVKLHYNASVGQVKIENFVAKVCMGFPIKLSELQSCILHKRFCDQQNRKFPCINYRIYVIEPKVTVRIFGNGIFLIQSAKSMVTLHKSVELMVPVLHQFRNRTDIPVDAEKLLPLFDCVGQYPQFKVDSSFTYPFVTTGSTCLLNDEEMETNLFDEFDVHSWIETFSRKEEKYFTLSVETKKLTENEMEGKNWLRESIESFNFHHKKNQGVYVRTANDCPFSNIFHSSAISVMVDEIFNYTLEQENQDVLSFYFLLTETNVHKHFLVSVEKRKVRQVTPFSSDQKNTWLSSMIEKDWTNYVLVRLWYLSTSNVIPRITQNIQNFTIHFSFNETEKLQVLQILPAHFAPETDDHDKESIFLKFSKV